MTFLTIEVRGEGAERPSIGSAVQLDEAERAAIDVLASSGLVPPLRLKPRACAG
ncbi:MAG: hypothetical protein ACOH2F_02575 [Cellulomonas sp.]